MNPQRNIIQEAANIALNEYQNSERRIHYFDTHMLNGVRSIAHMMNRNPSQEELEDTLRPHTDAYTEQLRTNHPDISNGELEYHKNELIKHTIKHALKIADFL